MEASFVGSEKSPCGEHVVGEDGIPKERPPRVLRLHIVLRRPLSFVLRAEIDASPAAALSRGTPEGGAISGRIALSASAFARFGQAA